MAQDQTANQIHHYRDRQVVLYRRERSHRWQARFKLEKGGWFRFSTLQYEKEKAAKYACDQYDESRFKAKYDKPQISRRFSSIANTAIAKMQQQLDSGLGKESFVRYIRVIQMYLIPYFGKKHIDNIEPADYQAFYDWVEAQGKELNRSNITNYNVALNRIFDIAITNGWMGKSQVPLLKNKGTKGKRRPDFSIDEYRVMVRALREWVKKDNGKEVAKQIRELLRDYVLILANTGLRPGRESNDIKWKHIKWHVGNDGEKYIHVVVQSGKTGKRDVIARHSVLHYLTRIQSRFPELAKYSFEDLLKANVDDYVFRLRNGKRTTGLGQNFEQFLREYNLIENSQGQDRVLYSLRHTYATFALLRGNNISIHDLAKNMGTSIQMIEQHYSHLNSLLRARDLAGVRLINNSKPISTE